MSIGRKRIYARLLIVVLACSVAFTIALGGAPSAHANANVTTLGGINLDGFCQFIGHPGVTTVGTTYYSWRCGTRDGMLFSFSMRDACVWQYNNGNAWDHTDNFYSAPSAVCFIGTALGGINLRAYCQSLRYSDVTLLGSTVYDWACVNSSGGLAGININNACQWMYNNSGALARFDDFYTATSWRCFG